MIRHLAPCLIALALFCAGVQMVGLEQSSARTGRATLKPTLKLGTQTYDHFCSACHGARGEGNGFNAGRLYVKPANHTDATFMSTRSDAKLYDVINMGGKGISKSSLMPPWGAVIGDTRIESLIIKLRDLCNCQAFEGG